MVKFLIEMLGNSIHVIHDLINSMDWISLQDWFMPKSDRTEAVKSVVEITLDQDKLKKRAEFLLEDYALFSNDLLITNFSSSENDFGRWNEDCLLCSDKQNMISLKQESLNLQSHIIELANREDLLKQQIFELETQFELEQQCFDLESNEILLREKISSLESNEILLEEEIFSLNSNKILLEEKISSLNSNKFLFKEIYLNQEISSLESNEILLEEEFLNLESNEILFEEEFLNLKSKEILLKEKISSLNPNEILRKEEFLNLESNKILREEEIFDLESDEIFAIETPVYNADGEIVIKQNMHKYPILYHDNRVLLSDDYIHGHPEIIIRSPEVVDVDYYTDQGWKFLLESKVSDENLDLLNLYNRRFERVYGGYAYSYDYQFLADILDNNKIRFKNVHRMALDFFPDRFIYGEGPNCFETELVDGGKLYPVPMDLYNRLFWDVDEPIPTDALERSLDSRTYYYMFEKLSIKNWYREVSLNPEIVNYPMNEALDKKMLCEFNALTEDEISDLLMTCEYETLINYGRLFVNN